MFITREPRGAGILVVLLAVMGSGQATAADWAPPTPRIYASELGKHAFKVLPGEGFFGQASGMLFTLDAKTGESSELWSKTLINTPDRAFVAETGEVVTLDTYAKLGQEHAVVVYGRDGKILGDYHLDQIFKRDELVAGIPTTLSGRWWRHSAEYKFQRPLEFSDKTLLDIHLQVGELVRVDLRTGKIYRPQPIQTPAVRPNAEPK